MFVLIQAYLTYMDLCLLKACVIGTLSVFMFVLIQACLTCMDLGLVKFFFNGIVRVFKHHLHCFELD